MLKKMILACSLLTGLNAFALLGCANNISINLDRINVYANLELSEKSPEYRAGKEALSARPTMFIDLELMTLEKIKGTTHCTYGSAASVNYAKMSIKDNQKKLSLLYGLLLKFQKREATANFLSFDLKKIPSKFENLTAIMQ